MTFKLVLVRHGESEWNRSNLFTGWTDVDLSEAGVAEARRAGGLLRAGRYVFDAAYTSVLTRAIRTLDIVLLEMGLSWVPVRKHWRLNERHYGALQGFNKAEMAEKEGRERVHRWRRSYDASPPPLSTEDPRYPGHDPRYGGVPKSELPRSESLKATVERFLPYWRVEIAPAISRGERLLIVAHGNSLRALVKYLDDIPDDEIPAVTIPTGMPLVYELNEYLEPVSNYYLGNGERSVRPAPRHAEAPERAGAGPPATSAPGEPSGMI